jgi:alginate O-acetyltransferase complex protein AlgI
VEFNSINFLVFFSSVALIFYSIPSRFRLTWLTIVSFFFYAWWNALFLGILVAVILITHLTSISVCSVHKNGKKTVIFIYGVTLILTFLVFFKYSAFVIESFLYVFHLNFNPSLSSSLHALLPIGISFYSFQAISYLVDVYKGTFKPDRSLSSHALFLAFFPQVLAGPIERASNLIPQLKNPNNLDSNNIISGLKRMLWGFCCKVLVADQIAPFVDRVYGSIFDQTGPSILVATYLFGFQIYFDFFGYTNIAIGAAQVFGIKLSQNFQTPYSAHSIRNFWHRWHITLSSWFRDYVYKPLGGSKEGHLKHVLAISTVFLLSGLWHGAAWNFVIWGGAHGIVYLAEEYGGYFKSQVICTSFRLPILFRQVITFNLVMMLWLFFRAESLSEITYALGTIGSPLTDISSILVSLPSTLDTSLIHLLLVVSLLGVIFVLDVSGIMEKLITRSIQSRQLLHELIIWDVLVILLVLLGDLGGREFVYFRF